MRVCVRTCECASVRLRVRARVWERARAWLRASA